MPFGFGSITSFANKAVSAATNAASEAAKVAEKAVDTAAKAAETATAQVAAVAGEPPPAGQAPAARPAAPRAAAPRPQVLVQQAPRAQAPQMQQGPQMQTPAPQQQVQPRPPVSQQQQQQQQQPQQPPMQRHTTPPQQAQTQQQHQQPPPPQQQQQPPQQQMQQQQPPQQQMQQQQPPQQQMQQPQQHVPLTHQSQNVPQSQPQSVNQAPMPQQSQHQAQNQLDQPISTHGGPLPPQGPPNQPGVSVSGPMGGPMGSNQGPPGQGPPFPSSPGPRGPRGMRPPMGPRGPMGPNPQMGSNTSMGPGGLGGPMGPRGMRPGGPRMRGPRPGMMGPGSRPGLSPSGLLRGPRPMSGPSGDMGDSMSGGPLLNQNGPPGSEFGPPNSMGPLQMGPPPHSMSDVPGDNSSSSMGFPQGMSSQPNQSGMNPNQQGPMNSDTNLVGNSGANNPHINDMSSGGMLPPHSSNSGPFPDQQHQSFNDHLQNGVMKLSLPPLDLDSSFPPLSSSNMDLFPLFDAQLPPFSSSSSLLPMLNSSLPPFDTSLPTDPFPPSEYQRRASLPNGPYSPVVSRNRRMSHQPPPHIEISSQDSSASNQGGSLAAHITHEPVRSPLCGNRSPEVSLKKIKSMEDEYDKIKLELLSGLDRDEELFSPCGPEIVPPLQKDQGPGSTRLDSATIGHTEASSSKSKRSKDNLESIFGESFDECGDGDLDGEDENEDTDERRRSSSHKHHNKTANRRTRHQSGLGESSPEPPDPRDRRMQTEIVEPSHTKSFMRDADTDDVLVDVNDSRNDPSRWQHARSNANINTSQVDSLKSGVGVLSHLPPSTSHVKAQHLEDDPFPVSVSPELELPTGSKTAPMSSSAARLDPFLGPVKERRSSMATGEVYTIPEMPEEEAGSPTTGDGVSCRRNRRGTATTSLIMSFPGLLSPKSNGHKEPSLLDGLLGLDEHTRKLRQKQQHQVFSKDENLSPIVIKAPNSPRKAMLRSPLRSEPSFEIRSSLEESPEKPVKSSPSQKSFVLSSVRQIESKQDSSNRSGSKESKTQHMAKASSPSPDDSPIQPKDFLSKVTENSSKFISSRDDPMGGSYFMEGPLGGSMDMFNTKSAKDAYNTRSFSLTSSSPPFPSSSPPMMIPESFGREGKDHHHQSPSKVNGMFSKQRSSSGLSPNDEYGSDRRKQFMTTSGNTVELSKPERLSERRDRLNFAMKRGNSSKSSHLNDLSASHDQLSPILDSSPLIEKIESNREKFRDQERQREREREESRKYRDENQHGTSTNRLNHHAGQYGNQLQAGGNNAQLGSSGQPQGESISGMLNNFSKALGNIRDIREKRMKNLGNSPRPSPSDPSSVNYQRIMQQYGGNQFSQGVQQGAQQQRSQYNQMHPQQMNQQQYRQQQPYQQQNYNQQGRMNQQGGGGSGGYGMNQGQQPQQGGYGSYNQQQQPMGGGMKPNNYGGQMGGMQNHSQPQQQQPMGGVGTQGSQYQQSYMGQQNLHPQQQQSNQMMGGMPQQGMMNQQPQHLQPHQQQQQQQQPMGNQMLHPQQSQQQNLGKTGASSLLHRRDHLHHHGSHHQPLAHIPSAALLHGATLVGTPDTLSEAGSFKSRTRRTLPYLPLEEPAPMPSEKKQRERMRAFANLRQSSLDGLTGRGFRSGTGGFYGSSRPRASSSETNLRKLAMNDHMTRPGSALGLLQASTVVSSKGPTSQTREHEKRILESILPPDLRHLVRGGSPGTIQQMKMKLEDELRKPLETMALATNASEGEMARKKAEARLFGLSGAQSDRIRLEMQRYATMRDPRLRAEMKHKLNPVLDAQLNRNRRTRGHRRNLSDPRFSTSLTDSLGEDDLHYSRPYSSLARDYDPLSDSLGMDNSRSYLGGSALDGMGVAGGGGGLRDTAINSHDLEDNSRNRYLASLSQQLLRRSSEGGSGNTDHLFTRNFDGTSPHTGRRAYSSMSGRAGPRSWHPSPFASDDDASSDEPQFFKEEKKNRIKMEIARRRQQIEENACLHEELTRLAKLRESAEMTGTTSGAPSHLVPSSTAFLGGTIHPANRGMTTAPDGTTSVLKSVDEILRDGGGGGGGGLGTSHHLGLSSDPFHSGMGVTGGANAVGFRGAGMGTFNSDLYTSSVYDRVTDFSPINSELSEFTTPRHMGGGGVGIMGHHHGLRTSAGGGVADDPFWSQGGKYSKSSAAAFK